MHGLKLLFGQGLNGKCTFETVSYYGALVGFRLTEIHLPLPLSVKGAHHHAGQFSISYHRKGVSQIPSPSPSNLDDLIQDSGSRYLSDYPHKLCYDRLGQQEKHWKCF